jgi:hypothetical protein
VPKPEIPSPEGILQSIEQANEGLGVSQLLSLHPALSRRTLQRRITELVTNHQLTVHGKGPSRKYRRLTQAVGTDSVAPPVKDEFPAGIPLSHDSRDIIVYVDLPILARKPVGYQRDFIESYSPNISSYLSESLRAQLHKMGQTTQVEQPAGTYSRAILNRLLIDLSWASSHLEGNTYSRLDTGALLSHGQVAKGKGAIETQMILNHKSAIELLVENIATVGFDRYTLMNLHAALSENLLPNPADEGRLRAHAVEIGKSVYRPLSNPQTIDETLTMLLSKINQIRDPFEQSFFAMVHLPYLQPFADINKRTSRLAANLPLFRANLCPLTFLDVPEQAYSRAILGVYELTRIELLRDLYVWAYERSTQEYLVIKQDLVEPDPARIVWRDLIKNTIHDVVLRSHDEADKVIDHAVNANVPLPEQTNVKALIIAEVSRLHEGVLARYGLRPSQFATWLASHKRKAPQ